MKKISFIIILTFILYGTNIYGQFKHSSFNSNEIYLSKDDYKPRIFENVGRNFIESFKSWNSFFHIAAITATYTLVETDVDANIFSYFKKHRSAGQSWFRPAEVTGVLLAPAVGLSLYFVGKKKKNNRALAAGCAVIQAASIGFVYNSFLKAITGRAFPNIDSSSPAKDLSRKFDFGFWNNGIGWGWPSGHTMATITTLSALTTVYPEKNWLKISSAALMAYTIVSVSATGGESNDGDYIMHWFSDGIAAALIGFSIGRSVGKYYSKMLNGEDEKNKISFFPVVYDNVFGIALNIKI